METTRSHGLIKTRWLWSVLAFLSIAGFNLLTLMRMPAPFVDEAWNASRAWGLLHTGHAFGSLDAGVFEHYDGYWTYFAWLGTAIHSAFMFLLGPTLLAVRSASLFFGLVLLALVYFIGSRLYSHRVGLISALLLSLSGPFLYSSHMARHDIIVAAFGFGAVALYLLGRDGRAQRVPWADLLSGLLLGLTLDIHLNGLIFVPVLGALYLVEYGWGVFLNKNFWTFALGGVLGALFFLALHVLPYPQTYLALSSLGNGARVTPPMMELNPALWLSSSEDALLLMGPFLDILALLAFVLLVQRRSSADRRTAILFGVLFLAFSEIVRNKMPWYMILVAPAACMVVAVFCDDAISTASRWRASALIFGRSVFTAALVVAYLVISLQPALYDSSEDFTRAIDSVRRTIPANATIVGSQTYWFALPDSRYLSWDQLVYQQRYSHGSLEEAFRTLHPDYLVVDGWLDLFITDDPARLATAGSNTLLPKTELETLLGRQADLVSTLPTSSFGDIRIYKLDWSR